MKEKSELRRIRDNDRSIDLRLNSNQLYILQFRDLSRERENKKNSIENLWKSLKNYGTIG